MPGAGARGGTPSSMTPSGTTSRDPGRNDRVRIVGIEILSDDWYVLRTATLDLRRPDGAWTRTSREAYDRGNGATALEMVDRGEIADGKTVILLQWARLNAIHG